MRRLQKLISFVLSIMIVSVCIECSITDYSVDAASNEEIIYSYMKNELGFNTAVACAALANIYSESGFNPDSGCTDTDGYPSYGICQWHLDRLDNLKKFCQNSGYDYTSLDGQLSYLKHEFETSYSKQYNSLKDFQNNEQGAYDAGYYWAAKFEVCASQYWNDRGLMAVNTYYPKYKDDINTQLPVTGDCNGDGKIDSIDASAILTYYIIQPENIEELGFSFNKEAADWDGNGIINVIDASAILTYYVSR